MQKKLEGKLLKKILGLLEKEDPKLYKELSDDQSQIYISKICAKSTYTADIPGKMIAYFRGGFLSQTAIEGKQSHLPTISMFCVYNKINFELIDSWRKLYKELDYAMKLSELVVEDLLQNEILTSRQSSGPLAVLKARIGGKWKDEKETKNQQFNIYLGNLADVQGARPLVITPDAASEAPLQLEAPPEVVEVVDPKTIDRVISVETEVDVINEGVEIRRKMENFNHKKQEGFVKMMTSRNEHIKNRAKKKIRDECRDLFPID